METQTRTDANRDWRAWVKQTATLIELLSEHSWTPAKDLLNKCRPPGAPEIVDEPCPPIFGAPSVIWHVDDWAVIIEIGVIPHRLDLYWMPPGHSGIYELKDQQREKQFILRLDNDHKATIDAWPTDYHKPFENLMD